MAIPRIEFFVRVYDRETREPIGAAPVDSQAARPHITVSMQPLMYVLSFVDPQALDFTLLLQTTLIQFASHYNAMIYWRPQGEDGWTLYEISPRILNQMQAIRDAANKNLTDNSS